MTGLVNKAIAKFNQDELCRYEKLFNTTYSVTTHSYLKFKFVDRNVEIQKCSACPLASYLKKVTCWYRIILVLLFFLKILI
jgi:hypothetical protein